MRHGAEAAVLHGKPRLRTVQRLDLTLLVEREEDGAFGRVEIEPDDVAQLGDEFDDRSFVCKPDLLRPPRPRAIHSKPAHPIRFVAIQPARDGRPRDPGLGTDTGYWELVVVSLRISPAFRICCAVAAQQNDIGCSSRQSMYCTIDCSTLVIAINGGSVC